MNVYDTNLSTVLKRVETDYNLAATYTDRRIIAGSHGVRPAILRFSDNCGLKKGMEYAHPLLRPTRVCSYHNNQPVGTLTETIYGAGTTEATRFVKVRSQIDALSWKEAYSWFDGLGRTYKSQSVDSSGDVFSETLFDSVGRPWKTSNPYRTGDTKLWTENFYDTARQPFKIRTPDGAEVETLYDILGQVKGRTIACMF